MQRKGHLHDVDVNVEANAKTKASREARLFVANQQNKTNNTMFRKESGLREPGKKMYDVPAHYGIAADAREISPCEIFHQEMMGIATLVLTRLFWSFTAIGQATFNEHFRNIRKGAMWRTFPKELRLTGEKTAKPQVKFKGFAGCTYGLVMQVLVLVLVSGDWLTAEMFTAKERTRLENIYGTDWLVHLLLTVVQFSQCFREVFAHSNLATRQAQDRFKHIIIESRRGQTS